MGKWFHVVCLVDNQNKIVQVWLNGTIAAAVYTADAIANVGYHYNLQLGRVGDGWLSERYFNGKLGEISIYNRALSESEIKYLYGVGSSSSGTVDLTPEK